MNNQFEQIEHTLTTAIITTVNQVKAQYPQHSFYYFALTTVEEALAPGYSIWSEELLLEAAHRFGAEGDPQYQSALKDLRYSYADSPLFYQHPEFFDTVTALFSKRPNLDDLDEDAYDLEVRLRLDAMVRALKAADAAGVFDTGKRRERWFINVEVNPPDGSNVDRARMLNGERAVARWLAAGGE